VTRLPTRDYTYFRTVRGMCRQCRQIVPARIFFQDEQVYQESLCPTCNNEPVRALLWIARQTATAALPFCPSLLLGVVRGTTWTIRLTTQHELTTIIRFCRRRA
jgi:hypothetical protein